MANEGICQSWKVGDAGQNAGYGFIEIASTNQTLFCHRTSIKDGSALQPAAHVTFDMIPNPRSPDKMMAINVQGGICFDFYFRSATGGCQKGDRCKFSHHVSKELSAEEAMEAVVAIRARADASDPQRQSGPILIDTLEACRDACGRLIAAGVPVAVDFEGVDLCRHGELCLAQLATKDGPTLLLDIVTLGQAAFDEGGLAALLESENVLKLVYDGRSDADALYHLHGCTLRNACDAQIYFTLFLDASKGSRTENLPGLGRALSSCPSLSKSDEGKALASLKKAVQALFVPELGGSYEVWKERPMRREVLEYAAADVVYLHALREAWSHLCDDETMVNMAGKRIEKAVHAGTHAKGQHMARRDF